MAVGPGAIVQFGLIGETLEGISRETGVDMWSIDLATIIYPNLVVGSDGGIYVLGPTEECPH